METKQGSLVKIQRDLASKLIDGIGTVVILLLLFGLLIFLQKPVDQVIGRPGLLAYAIVILAVSIFCLGRSVHARLSGVRQAWHGMIGGLLAWLVIWFTIELGGQTVSGLSATLGFLMTVLITATLWRQVLPVGVRFFSFTFLLNWFAWLLTLGVRVWFVRLVYLGEIFRVMGYLCLVGAVITMGWMLYYSERRMQRLWFGLWTWFFCLLMVMVFWGNLFYNFA
ncbi:MAG: hypothetical protein HPY59_11980 [Anaerolineae bacterium]|nr:hypothetical protein [Anaerolineae bacterium]